ncbi:MAG: anthranilate phosphoribosyltransferase [Robiginitomaculum sp.]|nr:MAG: anthranilate phosphoribosyltransferase [Robiginitomaculum sp.]
MSGEFKSVFENMISGTMPDDDICKHLLAWEDKGVTAEQLHVATSTLCERMIPVNAPDGAMDIVGTGGDGLKTYNISTAVAFVVAGAGVPVAKHGNRAVSSKSGASDVLSELGVKLDISPALTEACILEAGVGFLFAPNHHKAMGHVASARATLGVRTIFNCLGPLCNPASVQHYLLGVYDNPLRETYAQALVKLGVKRALVVHGHDGMDEITTTGASMISEVNGQHIKHYRITPNKFNIARVKPEELRGGNAVQNAHALMEILHAKQNAYGDIVALNAGAALYASGMALSIAQGITMARQSVGSGAALNALNKLVEVSNAPG